MRALGALLLVLSTGCALVSGLSSLDVGPEAPADASAPLDASGDASADAIADVSVVIDASCADASCAGIDPGWTPVGYVEGTCPKGWGSLDFVTNPTLGTACACGCSVTTQPTCDVGTCPITAGTSPSCSLGTINLNFNGGNCVSFPQVTLAPFQKIVPLALAGGACTATANPAGVATTAARLCAPPDCGTAASLCSSGAPNGIATCVTSSGDLACPGAYPVRHVVGVSAAAACNSTCTCKVGGTCTSPKVTFYSDTQCTNLVVTNDATGTCAADVASGMQVHAAKCAATVAATCNPSGAAAGTVSLVGVRTVCCRP